MLDVLGLFFVFRFFDFSSSLYLAYILFLLVLLSFKFFSVCAFLFSPPLKSSSQPTPLYAMFSDFARVFQQQTPFYPRLPHLASHFLRVLHQLYNSLPSLLESQKTIAIEH